MAFRIFRLLVGVILIALAALLVVGGLASVLKFNADSLPGGLSGLLTFAGKSGTSVIASIMKVVLGLAVAGVYYYSLWSGSSIKRVLENIFSIPELVKKLAFTLGLLCIYRIGFHIPLPGIDAEALRQSMAGGGGGGLGDAIEYFGMFTGGSLQQSTLFGLGIMPYISASIIFQLASTVVPALEKLKKEGPAGYKKIQEYTRYATVPLCLIEAVFYMKFLNRPDQPLLYDAYVNSFGVYMMCVLGLTTGTMFLMWLGEQIDEYGIGNGISLLIMAGIVSRLPFAIGQLASQFRPKIVGASSGEIGLIEVLALLLMFVGVVAGAILITQGQRRIPIQQAKQMRGRRVYGGQRQYLPLRVNHGGVMPLIFASSLMIFPGVVLQYLSRVWPSSSFLAQLHTAFQGGQFVYEICYIGLIFFFAYFWTTVQFRPKEMSEQLQDYGTFIPGLRPGRRTAEYLEKVMERITYCGAAFLSVIAVIPSVVQTQMKIPFQISAFLGGTGLLIVVSVALDLVQRIESNLVMRNYGGFLGGSTRIKGAYS